MLETAYLIMLVAAFVVVGALAFLVVFKLFAGQR